MGKIKYLANNIALFSISNFVSKILVFLLVPFYTNVLTTYEYGVADVFQVTLLLLVPAITVNMGEAVLRFGIERENDRGSILKCGIKYVLRADLIVAIVSLVAAIFLSGEMRSYILIFAVMFATNSLYEFLILYYQGCEFVNIVAIGSICCTISMIACNLYFLLVLRTGLYGYLMSQIIAYTVACIVMSLIFKRSILNTPFAYVGNESLEKEMLDYSRPMIAYSTGAWVNNASDRYIVSWLCGASINGIYGVAYKIPAILMVFQRIFAQAWQMSATKSYNDKNSDEFFSLMYKTYHTIMVIGCALLILLVRYIAAFMFRKEFYDAWRFVPPLLISVVFGALTGFLGSICLAHKDSKSMGIATGVGAVLNVVMNICLVPLFSAMGAAAATAVSYFVMYFMALIFVLKHTKLEINYVRDYIAYFLLSIEGLVQVTVYISGMIKLGICFVIVLTLVIMHFSDVRDILGKLLDVIKSKGKSKTAA